MPENNRVNMVNDLDFSLLGGINACSLGLTRFCQFTEATKTSKMKFSVNIASTEVRVL